MGWSQTRTAYFPHSQYCLRLNRTVLVPARVQLYEFAPIYCTSAAILRNAGEGEGLKADCRNLWHSERERHSSELAAKLEIRLQNFLYQP